MHAGAHEKRMPGAQVVAPLLTAEGRVRRETPQPQHVGEDNLKAPLVLLDRGSCTRPRRSP